MKTVLSILVAGTLLAGTTTAQASARSAVVHGTRAAGKNHAVGLLKGCAFQGQECFRFKHLPMGHFAFLRLPGGEQQRIFG